MRKIERPKISVCAYRHKVSIACFDGFDCIRKFVDYQPQEEGKGIDEARKFLNECGVTDEPEIVRPSITKMRMSYRK